jgi:hypothetical protein
MDPVTMATVAAITTAAGTAVGAYGQSQSMKAQAKAEQQRAEIEGKWAERRALEERSSAQRAASEEMRKARFAQSRLTALAGEGASDPTVMDLFGDIEKEGRFNAATATAAGEQKASGMEYQAALDQWGADTNARIKKSAANTTLISGLLSAGGQFSGGMAGRYGGFKSSGGYGRYG